MKNSQSDSEISESFDADDSQTSTSSSSSSSTSSSSGLTNYTTAQSDEDVELQTEDTLELAQIDNALLRLPRALCENSQVFYEFFSPETWLMLPEDLQHTLDSLLPTFTDFLDPEEAAAEADRTLNMLLNNELYRFGTTPLNRVQEQLEAGNYRPDVVKLRKSIAKSHRREQRFHACEQVSHLARELFVCRERLLRSAYKSAPDEQFATPGPIESRKHLANLCADTKLYVVRARQRYAQELERLVQHVGLQPDMIAVTDDDEDDHHNNVVEGADDEQHKNDDSDSNNSWTRNIFKTGTNGGSSTMDKCIYGTLFKRQHDLTDEDSLIAQRNAKQPRLTNKNFLLYLNAYKRRKLTEPNLPEYEIADIRLRDVCTRAQMGGNFKRIFAAHKSAGRKPKNSLLGKYKNLSVASNKSTMSESNDQDVTDMKINNYKNEMVDVDDTLHYMPHIQNINNNNNNNCEQLEDDDNAIHGFDILDSEVELQQEEVVATYSNEDDDIHVNNYIQQQQQLQQQQQTINQNHLNHINSKTATTIDINDMQTTTATPTTTSSLNYNNNNSAFGMTVLPKLEPLQQQQSLQQSLKIQNNNNTSSYKQTHACFFSLIRDLFCETTHHRMQLKELHVKIENWLHQPLTIFNTWYTLLDNWSLQLQSAIDFLTGEFMQLPDEYVPYLEYKSQTNIYQWIGAGRDSDVRLSTLCGYWLQKRKPSLSVAAVLKATTTTTTTSMPSFAVISNTKSDAIKSIENSDMTTISATGTTIATDNSNIDTNIEYQGIADNIPPDPAPRCPTNWTIRTATPEEISDFQRQERERFETPHKAYTYRMHGYESVVGPVKGIYSQIYALTKARGHSMMVGDRPNFVTILTLVRDAVSRLPNGEGTRADISELVKSSQYLNHNAAENVLQTIVSGALDRMHTEIDPCVRYDSKRKIWIYLHRNRSEEEFERIHQQQQGIGRHKKPTRKPSCKKITGNSTSPITTMSTSPAILQIPSTTSTPTGVLNTTILSQPPPLTAVTDSQLSNSPPTSSLPLPALVPANSLSLFSPQQQQQPHLIKQKQQILLKCPPVPPLKYHTPPHTSIVQHQQQQKSLLKSTRVISSIPAISSTSTITTTTTSTSDSVNYNSNNNDNSSNDNQRILVRTFKNANINSGDNISENKIFLTQQQQNVHGQFTRTMSTTATTPTITGTTKLSNTKSKILLATPTGLQQVQTIGTNTTTPTSGIIVTPTSALGGKRLGITNKPIIINQVTNSSGNNNNNTNSNNITTNNNSNNLQPHQQQQQQFVNKNKITKQQQQQLQTNNQLLQKQQQQQQQTTQSFIIPLNDATLVNDSNGKQQNTSGVQAMFLDNGQLTTIDGSVMKQQQQPKNIIRWVPATANQTIQQQQQQQLHGQQKKMSPIQILRTQKTGLVTQQHQQQQILGTKTSSGTTNIGGISIITSGTTTGVVGGNTIVKMTPQAFAALQQQQIGKSPQHIVLKTANIVSGSGGISTTTTSTTNASSQQQHQRLIITGQGQIKQQQHNVIHTLTPIGAAATTTIPSSTSTIISPNTTVVKKNGVAGAGTVQTITATSLSPQEQRILLQNLKQIKQKQQQFRTSTGTTGTGTGTTTTTKQTHIISPVQQYKQQQTLTRFIKTSSSSAVATDQQQLHTQIISTTPTTRLLTSASGQVISLEELLQKQRVICSTKDTTAATTTAIPQIVTLTNNSGAGGGQQQQQQFGVVVSPNTRGIISIATTTTTGGTTTPIKNMMTTNNTTVGQRIISTSAAGNNFILTSKTPSGITTTTPITTKLVNNKTSTTTQITATSTAIKTLTSGGRVITMSGNPSNSNNNNGNRNNATASVAANNIRIINATNAGNNVGTGGTTTLTGLNFANLQGKQVVFATKQQQSQLQNAGMVIGGQTVKLQTNLNKNNSVPQLVSGVGSGGQQLQTVIVGNQILRVQQLPRQTTQQSINKNTNTSGTINRLTFPVNKGITTTATTMGTGSTASPVTILNDGNSSSANENSATFPKTLVMGSTAKTIHLQTAPKIASVKSFVTTQNSNIGTSTTTGNNAIPTANRIVLAMQSGQPIILPPGSFQSGTINLKSLQNMKLVSLASGTAQPSSVTVKKDE